jgi:hypothetical protein
MNAVKGFFGSIVKFLKKLFTNTSWQTTAQAILVAVSAGVENILELTSNEAEAAAIAVVVNEVKAGFAAISALITQYDSQVHTTFVSQVTAILNDIKADLSSLLSAGQIKDTGTLTSVTKWVSLIVSDIESLLGLIPVTAPAAPVAAPAAD